MKAAACSAYGPPGVVRLIDMPIPQPKPGEVLIRILAASVASADWRIRSGTFPRGFGLIGRLIFGLRRQRQPVLGTEFAGVVTETGAGVTRFRPGDPVVAFPGAGMRCHAEYRTMPQDGRILSRPDGLSDAEAASLFFGGTTALCFLRDIGKLAPGEKVLVLGASGAVGSAAVQIARALGADVTAVCSGGNADLVHSLGAGRVIDYGAEDFTTSGERWDIILDTVGASTFDRSRQALSPAGRFLVVAGDLPALLATAFSGGRARSGTAPERLADMENLVELATRGQYRPVIDSCFALDDIAAAHARVETGRKRGNVVVQMTPG
jgi:NADPH:quinone reductase-like Zn-dependent oxidoreductase